MSIPSVNRQQSIVCPLHTIPVANHVESNKNSEKKIKQKKTPVYTQNRIAPTIVRSRPPVPRPPMTTSNGRMVPYGQEVLTSQPCVLSRGHRLDRAFQDSCCWFNRGRVDWQGRGGEKSGRDRFLHRLEGVC